MLNPTQQSALRLMFTLASEDCPADLQLLAGAMQLACVQVDELLSDLERAGLVDAERVRLTLPGLAIAASLPAASRAAQCPPAQRPQHAAPAKRRRRSARRAA